MKRKAYGFTIVELLIVIVVIGILAAVSVVAYNGVNNRARVASASSALDQARKKLDLYRVENGSYPADLSTAGIAGSSGVAYGYSTTNSNANFCLTATVGDISYYLDNDTKTSPTEGGCNGHTWPGGIAMTNLVTNGDFSNGTSGWGTSSSYSNTAVSGEMLRSVVVSGATADYMYATSGLARSPVSGHIHYISYDLNPFRTHTPGAFLGGVSGSSGIVSSAGTFTRISLLITTTSGGTRQLHLYANANSPTGATVGATTKYKNISVIDLTATFGAGKEPTKAQMDLIMNQFPNKWFNGTVTANTRGIL